MNYSSHSSSSASGVAPGLPFGTVAGRALIALFAIAGVFTVLSIWVITGITHNFYVASYYTLGTLFDTNPLDSDTLIAMEAPALSSAFYVIFTMSVLDGIVKAVLIGFVIAAFINYLRGIDITSRIGVALYSRLKGHVIVCGYSMLAERLCRELARKKMQFVVLDKSPEKIALLRDEGYRTMSGDFTKEQVLRSASLSSATAVVFATESDFINLLGVVTAKHLEPSVKIITRASNEIDAAKMRRGGARFCLVPEVVGGLELGESIMRLW